MDTFSHYNKSRIEKTVSQKGYKISSKKIDQQF